MGCASLGSPEKTVRRWQLAQLSKISTLGRLETEVFHTETTTAGVQCGRQRGGVTTWTTPCSLLFPERQTIEDVIA
jgi:hypothetical protein